MPYLVDAIDHIKAYHRVHNCEMKKNYLPYMRDEELEWFYFAVTVYCLMLMCKESVLTDSRQVTLKNKIKLTRYY